MVLRVKPTPTRLPTNSLYTPVDNTPLHFIHHPWEAVLSAKEDQSITNSKLMVAEETCKQNEYKLSTVLKQPNPKKD